MKESNSIRVMIVDDHELIRHGLGLALETFDDLELVATAPNGLEAVQQCRRHRPEVILMDLLMPGMDGVETTAKIRRQFPDTTIVILTSFNEVDMVEAALRAGAKGYLLKNVSIDRLAQTIREVSRNGQDRTKQKQADFGRQRAGKEEL